MSNTDHLSEIESLRSQVSELSQKLAERDQSMQDLREQSDLLQTVLDALPLGVRFTDTSGKPILVNPVAQQMWPDITQVGIGTGGNAAGWREATGPSGELHRWALGHALTLGVATPSETFNLECLDGTKKTIRNSTVSVQDETGEVLGAIVLNEDITLLRQAQDALQLTQFSVDHAVEGFFWIDSDGRIVHINDAACRMLEYTRDELTTMTLHDIDPYFSPEAWPAHWEELKQKGSMTFESKYRSRTGRILDTEVTVNYLQYEGKEYHCAIMRDIGERKRGKEELVQLAERLELATSAAQIGVWDWNIQKNELAWDDRMFALYGVKKEDFGGVYDAWLSGVHPDDLARCDEAIRLAIGKEKSYDIDFRIRWPNGTVRIIKADGQVIWDADGTPLRMIGVNYDITERTQTEMKLDEVNHRLRVATESAGIGFWEYEILENRLVWDEHMLALYDYRPENFPGAYEAWSQRLHPDDKAQAEQALQAAIAGQRNFDTEFRLILPSGAVRYIKAYAQVLKNDEAVPTRMIGVNYDITLRKQAETQFQRVVESTPNGMLMVNRSGIITLINRQIEQQFGYTRAELLGQPVELLMPERFRGRHPGLRRAFFTTPSIRAMGEGRELFGCRKDGTDFPIEIGLNPIETMEGLHVLASIVDITARKQAEEALQEQTLRLHAIVNHAADGIITIDEYGVMESFNPAAERLFGYQAAEAIGQNVKMLMPEPSHSEHDGYLANYHRTGQAKVIGLGREVVGRRKDGSVFPFELGLSKTQLGTRRLFTGIVHDITERKRIEEALRQREHDLKAALQERERISQDLHDGILQSLFAVGLTLEASKSMLSPRSRKASGASLDQAIDQLNRVMREVRSFIMGLGSELLEGIDLRVALQQMLKPLTENQATHVRLAVEDRAAKALSVEQSLHLFRVIQEAVSNCIQHGRAQEANVSLKMLRQGVRLSIRDNGLGFNKDAAKGAGQGLRNMATRAQRIGGRFTVFSKVNEGTRIVLDLPKEVSDVSS